jgi:hypothetical protein
VWWQTAQLFMAFPLSRGLSACSTLSRGLPPGRRVTPRLPGAAHLSALLCSGDNATGVLGSRNLSADVLDRGPILERVGKIIQHARSAAIPASEAGRLQGVGNPVKVGWIAHIDKREVAVGVCDFEQCGLPLRSG